MLPSDVASLLFKNLSPPLISFCQAGLDDISMESHEREQLFDRLQDEQQSPEDQRVLLEKIRKMKIEEQREREENEKFAEQREQERRQRESPDQRQEREAGLRRLQVALQEWHQKTKRTAERAQPLPESKSGQPQPSRSPSLGT